MSTEGGPLISVVIPNYNGEKTIGICLEAVLSSDYGNFEVIVVDDCSNDGSVDVIKKFPCKLIRLEGRSGASRARNVGAINASGRAIFFTDADCVVEGNTLSVAAASFREDAVVGGTYTLVPYDKGFYGRFQSVFINYSETKNKTPDYIATHAMLIPKSLFEASGGFKEEFMPIIEDVEFSHRLKKSGINLLMNPKLKVRHIFGFSLVGSLRNAFRKSSYWTAYSIKNKDLIRDSGTASIELKVNSLSWLIGLTLIASYYLTGSVPMLYGALSVSAVNLVFHWRFIAALLHAESSAFFPAAAWIYYSLIYPVPVLTGGLTGVLKAVRLKGI